MMQNHLFQLLSMVAIEPPVSFDADAVCDEKSKVLRAIQPFTGDVLTHAVRGQYGAGAVKEKSVSAYRHEPARSVRIWHRDIRSVEADD